MDHHGQNVLSFCRTATLTIQHERGMGGEGGGRGDLDGEQARLAECLALNSSPGLIAQEQTGVSAESRKAGPRQKGGEVSGLPGPTSPLISLSTCGRAAEEVIPVYATGASFTWREDIVPLKI